MNLNDVCHVLQHQLYYHFEKFSYAKHVLAYPISWEILYSGKITRGENFRYIRDLNTSANLRNREYLYIKLKNVCVIV
jgi:hypothetical protein